MRLWRARVPREAQTPEGEKLSPGTIFSISESGFQVKTGDAFLSVFEYEPLENMELKVGSQLGSPL